MKKILLLIFLIFSLEVNDTAGSAVGKYFTKQWKDIETTVETCGNNFKIWNIAHQHYILKSFFEKTSEFFAKIDYSFTLENLNLTSLLTQEIIARADEYQGDQLYSILPDEIACYLEEQLNRQHQTKFVRHLAGTTQKYLYLISLVFHLFDHFSHNLHPQSQKFNNLIKKYSTGLTKDETCTLLLVSATILDTPVITETLCMYCITLIKNEITESWFSILKALRSYEEKRSKLKEKYPKTLSLLKKINPLIREKFISELFTDCFENEHEPVFLEHTKTGWGITPVLESSPDTRYFCTGLGKGNIEIFSMSKTQKHLASLTDGHKKSISSLIYSPKQASQSYLFSASDKEDHITVWDTKTWQSSHSLRKEKGGINALLLSSDGTKLFSILNNNTIEGYDTTSWQCFGEIKADAQITAAILVPVLQPKVKEDDKENTFEDKYLIVGCNDGTLIPWDITVTPWKKYYKHTELHKHRGTITALEVSPDKTKLFSASCDGTIIVWSPPFFSHIETFKGHENTSSSLVISPNGKYLFSAAPHQTTKVWELTTKKDTEQEISGWKEIPISKFRMRTSLSKLLAKKDIFNRRIEKDILLKVSEDFFINNSTEYPAIRNQYIQDFYKLFPEILGIEE